jgi:hypothetical protein
MRRAQVVRKKSPMSVSISTLPKIRAMELFDGRLRQFGIFELVSTYGTKDQIRYITNYVVCARVTINKYGYVESFDVHGLAGFALIRNAILKSFFCELKVRLRENP